MSLIDRCPCGDRFCALWNDGELDGKTKHALLTGRGADGITRVHVSPEPSTGALAPPAILAGDDAWINGTTVQRDPS